MKFNYSGLLIALLLLTFWSCDENPRVIIPFVPEGDRIILLEEFTGKGCSNCPKGSREIDNLVSLFGENLVVVSIHAGFFADPDIFDIGNYDLRTDEGEALFDYLGPNSGYPAGVVNRTPFNSELQLTASAWASVITSELEKSPEFEFQVNLGYDQAMRKVTVDVEGFARQNISGDLRMSVMLAESGIVDAQDDVESGGIVDDYVHKHVLRDMLTKFDGESIGSSFAVGDPINFSAEGFISEDWEESKIDVIAFITNVQQNSFVVLQAGEAHLID